MRGGASRTSFCKRLGLSYTFVRSLEAGTRLPSDSVLEGIARALGLDADVLIVVAYCDRSKALADALARQGLVLTRYVAAALPDFGAEVLGVRT